jgi:DinB family protein
MQFKAMIANLEKNREIFRTLISTVTDNQATWRPAPQKWTVLEIVNHLVDEEVEDFRTRLEYTLFRPGTPWPPIDPPAWVSERQYAHRDISDSLQNFIREREASILWLRSLQEPDWDKVYEHPKLGRIRAGDLMASWVAHDLLHLRQLIGLHWQYTNSLQLPYNSSYAGDW